MTNPLPSSARSALREAEPHEAGRELDALIAERVFGYVWHAWEDSGPFTYLLLPTDTEYGEVCIARRRDGVLELNEYHGPHYSTDIAAAWLVVEKLISDGWCPSLSPIVASGAWYVDVWRAKAGVLEDHNVTAANAPIAICRAALLASSPTGGTTE